MTSARVLRVASGLMIAAVVLAALSPAGHAADRSDGLPLPLDLPAGPARAGFEPARFSASANGLFETFHVQDTERIRDALAAGLVAEDTIVLVIDLGRDTLALLTEQMAYHHIAQGQTAGTEWLVSFCVVCNTGTRLVPSIDGSRHTFRAVGVYDGVMVMQDVETKSLWNHITGEALYGPLVGHTLGPVGNVLHMNVRQALAMNPDARIAISDRVYMAGRRQLGFLSGVGPGSGSLTVASDWRPVMRQAQLAGQPRSAVVLSQNGPDPNATLSDLFIATLGKEDERRPRMELGLGIWTGTTSRFYPMALIRSHGGALIDRLDGRPVLLYIDPATSVPAALFVDAAEAQVENSRIQLDSRHYVETGMLFDAGGRRLNEERPQQLFTRWYGFALTFPDTGIFGQE